MKKTTAIIIDDEISALKGLQHKVEKLFPEIEILETYQKPETAIVALKKKSPDIVFLDIEMPRMNGFELLAALETISFQVIFVTAYNEYALKALKRSAVDYILKPVDSEELKTAVQKALANIKEKSQNEMHHKLVDILHETFSKSDKLIVPTAKGLSFIPQEEVLHLEGCDGYTKIHLTDTSEILSSYNLGRFEKEVGRLFFKCHKSHIINLEKVRSFENEGYVVLDGNRRVPISKTYRKAFLQLIGK
ncbi:MULTISPECIES: LytTR family DNA-binding domain-containing protein [Altibacter]|uniref:LytR/AlgR family response regulator transcription factor n=1 Tax=Altibacter TaxID=1535231 RepID=UPI0005585AD3|nr:MULTISPECIES: LytTR family DNA-binding domain-containing protein [Altibacter]MCW9037633.1 LytTR family DNA-binding domain-containing protein [Altibacter sp.]